MCIFTGSVSDIRSTKIFGRLEGAEQLIAYGMKMAADVEVAMVLPLPIAPGCGEDAVRFIDLSGHPELFDELDALFPGDLEASLSFGAEAPAAANLVVHEVGSFVASYVPSIPDFSRLDARFRLSPAVWSALPQFADHGFAVFQLAAGKIEVHPMALAFPTRDPSRVYFPCVHVHDGEVHDTASFDHVLYCQAAAPAEGWEPSIWPPTEESLAGSRGILSASNVYRTSVNGVRANRDIHHPA